MKDLPDLKQRVLDFIGLHNLFNDNKPLLLAVSGGPDSVCLLHILRQLRDELNLNLSVVHLNHQLRGEESAADARYVMELARRLNIPAIIESRNVLSYKTKYRLSLEEAARDVRYSFFAEVAAKIGTDRVVVGHTQDDHIETILMHIIRGSGTRGLRGLQPVSRWQMGGNAITVVRPLLTITRAETQAYCRANHLEPRTDATNESLAPLRNKVRMQLVPLLKEYNPRTAEALLRTAKIAADEIDFIAKLGEIAWVSNVKIKNNTAIINKEWLTGAPPAIQRHLLRQAIEQLVGNLRDVEAHHIEDMLAALGKPAGKIIQLPYNLVFVVEYDNYLIGIDPAALSPFPHFEGEFKLNVPGKTSIGGWTVKTEILNRKSIGKIPLTPLSKKQQFTAYLDFDKVKENLTVRTYRTGDRFQPLGMGEPKKLGIFMIDARIPHAWRSRIPLVCAGEQIVWVVGYRLDERVKVTEEMERELKVEFRKAATRSKTA
jgi:tRNA(Ile)-lysidine synthase